MKALLLLWMTLCGGSVALAHEMSMAELDMREMAKGQFIGNWGQSDTGKPIASDLTPS